MNKFFLKLTVLLMCILSGFTSLALADDIKNTKHEILFNAKSYPIAAIDPSVATNLAGSYYPGLRGANQLIIYTPNYGLRTNTNEFGMEAIVEKNIVSSLSGADSIVPAEGLVISGHGRAKKWMGENIIVGSKIFVDKENKILNVYLTSESYIYGAQAKIKTAKDIVQYYKTKMENYNYQTPCSYIERAEYFLKKAEKYPNEIQKYSALAIEAADKALEFSIPYDDSELRGVWIRPQEKSPEAIGETLDRLQNAGINNIYLETYFHGKTIFPSVTMDKYMFQKQNENFIGFDPLTVWITEAHRRGIKVNIWFETFYVGNKNPQINSKSILAVKPKWANVTKKNFDSLTPVPSLSEHNGYFLDPANPEVQIFLQELLTEIILKYSPDGINLDYIRYPQSIAAKFSSYDLTNWGYTEFARNEFKTLYGIDPIDIPYKDPNWTNWDNYRRAKISEFVQKVSCLTKPKNIELTAVIFPDRQKALETKQQDWKKWSYEGYVNAFTPLLLTTDSDTAAEMMKDVYSNKSVNTGMYAGIFSTFMSASEEDLLLLIHTSRKMRAKGVIIFDYAHFGDKYINTLIKSAFNKNSVLPQQQCKNDCQTKPKKRFKFKR